MLKITFSVDHDGKSYTYEAVYEIVNDNVDATIDHIHKENFLAKDMALAQSSFIRQIRQDKLIRAYNKVDTEEEFTGQDALDAMKLGKITNGSLLPEKVGAMFAPFASIDKSKITPLLFDTDKLVKSIEKNSGEPKTLLLTMPTTGDDGRIVGERDVKIKLDLGKRTFVGEEYYTVDMILEEDGKTYIYPLRYQKGDTESDNINKLLKAKAYFMRHLS